MAVVKFGGQRKNIVSSCAWAEVCWEVGDGWIYHWVHHNFAYFSLVHRICRAQRKKICSSGSWAQLCWKVILRLIDSCLRSKSPTSRPEKRLLLSFWRSSAFKDEGGAEVNRFRHFVCRTIAWTRTWKDHDGHMRSAFTNFNRMVQYVVRIWKYFLIWGMKKVHRRTTQNVNCSTMMLLIRNKNKHPGKQESNGCTFFWFHDMVKAATAWAERTPRQHMNKIKEQCEWWTDISKQQRSAMRNSENGYRAIRTSESYNWKPMLSSNVIRFKPSPCQSIFRTNHM